MGTKATEIVAAVKHGGAPASSALAKLLVAGAVYPGNVSDVEALTSDFSPAAFGYPVAAVAWAYLEIHGADRYAGEDEKVARFVQAAVDGSLF